MNGVARIHSGGEIHRAATCCGSSFDCGVDGRGVYSLAVALGSIPAHVKDKWAGGVRLCIRCNRPDRQSRGTSDSCQFHKLPTISAHAFLACWSGRMFKFPDEYVTWSTYVSARSRCTYPPSTTMCCPVVCADCVGERRKAVIAPISLASVILLPRGMREVIDRSFASGSSKESSHRR